MGESRPALHSARGWTAKCRREGEIGVSLEELMATDRKIHEPTVGDRRVDPRSDREKLPLKTMRARPFLKWAGGKGKLVSKILSSLPSAIQADPCRHFDYCEGFLGSGALLFEILEHFYGRLDRVVVNDVNEQLINVFLQVRDQVDALIEGLENIREEFNRRDGLEARAKYYYEKRERYNMLSPGTQKDALERALWFVFLNKTCYNGMYRVNRHGKYNVPFGKYKTINLFDAEVLKRDSQLFQELDVEFRVGSYVSLFDVDSEKTLFYFDPPYKPLNLTSSFTAYSPDSFDDEQQEELARFCQALQGWVLASNSIHQEYFEHIYGPRFTVDVVETVRTINSKAELRGRQEEVLIKNYTS